MKLAKGEGKKEVKIYADVMLQPFDLLLKNIAAALKGENLIEGWVEVYLQGDQFPQFLYGVVLY